MYVVIARCHRGQLLTRPVNAGPVITGRLDAGAVNAGPVIAGTVH